MDNMPEQFLSGLIPTGLLIAFIVFAIYTFKTKVLPNCKANQEKDKLENEKRDKN